MSSIFDILIQSIIETVKDAQPLDTDKIFSIDPLSPVSHDEQVTANILGTKNTTYEEYLKLIKLSDELSKFEKEFIKNYKAGKISSEYIPKYQYIVSKNFQICFKIGNLNALHPDWMAKHFPEFVKK